MAANPVFHIKDSYFFDVPKVLWQHQFKSLDEVPQYLRKAHPDATLQEFEAALAGKVLIPQPFGTPKNLYERGTGLCISKFMIIEVVVALILFVIFKKLSQKVEHGVPARGRFWNAIEAVLLYVRDAIVRPSLDSHHHDEHDDHGHSHGQQHADSHDHAHQKVKLPVHDGDRFLPILWTLFFFILGCNLFGMLPWAGAPTGSFAVTLSLAAVTLLTGVVVGIQQLGPAGYLFNMIPGMNVGDAPGFVKVVIFFIKILIFVIELAGLLIKHGVLAIRLLANIVAGHLVLLAIMGMIEATAHSPAFSWGSYGAVTTISVLGSSMFSILELGVAFLQAYVFTFLSSLFISSAFHSH